jgi:multicomponent Na+:H+ antiporter subunit G
MSVIEAISAALLLGGAVLGIGGGVGLLRFPDFYTRLHAAGITDTLCAGLFLSGLALHFGWSLASAKLLMIFAFLMFTSPTACNALARTAWRAGLLPWTAPAKEGRD